MRKLIATVVTLLTVASACSGATPETSPDVDPTVDLNPGDVQLVSRLIPFQDCRDLLDHIQAEARERVGPYGLDYQGSPWGLIEGDDVAFDTAQGDEEAPAEASSDSAGGDDTQTAATGGDAGSDGDFTGTNVQELGVDEPDIIKTDGNRIIVVAENTLTYVDLSTGDGVVTDRLQIPDGWGHELFFEGDRALLFTRGDWGHGIPIDTVADVVATDDSDAEAQFADGQTDEPSLGRPAEPEWFGPSSTIYELDLSDPDDLEITSTLRIQGDYLSARRVGDTVRLALTSPPSQLAWVYPGSPAGEERAERFNRELVDETTLEDWIPTYELTTADGTSSGPLLDCDDLQRPAEFSGFDVVSVLSFDLDGGLDTGDAAGVLAGGRTIYASADRFYVATTKWAGDEIVDNEGWERWSETYTTDIHAFAIATGEPASYMASGTVPGSLLNQFSLDEHDGYLRVITTDGSPWDDRNQSETSLTVLQEDGNELLQVGQVGGLGKGETLYAARLMDDVGFAVTFRQVDPFYVLDLSDPTDPRVSGELKIPGFSTYLHPVSEDLVLGVGQAGTEDGRTTGLKVSLFDVADPTEPREVAQWTMADASSAAEYDHRAFQFLAAEGSDKAIAIVPAQSWTGDFTGAVLLEIDEGSITELGRVTHVADTGEPASDCDPLESDRFSQDTELFWMAQDGRVQFCDADDNGGYGDWYCDPIPLDEIRNWGPEAEMSQIVESLGGDDIGPEDRIEICYPDGGNWRQQIQRSLVIGDQVWTMSWARLQANRLDDGLATTDVVDIG